MPKGDPRTPMSHDELLAKFDHLAGLALDPAGVAHVKDYIMHLERHDDLAELFGHMEAGLLPGSEVDA